MRRHPARVCICIYQNVFLRHVGQWITAQTHMDVFHLPRVRIPDREYFLSQHVYIYIAVHTVSLSVTQLDIPSVSKGRHRLATLNSDAKIDQRLGRSNPFESPQSLLVNDRRDSEPCTVQYSYVWSFVRAVWLEPSHHGAGTPYSRV